MCLASALHCSSLDWLLDTMFFKLLPKSRSYPSQVFPKLKKNGKKNDSLHASASDKRANLLKWPLQGKTFFFFFFFFSRVWKIEKCVLYNEKAFFFLTNGVIKARVVPNQSFYRLNHDETKKKKLLFRRCPEGERVKVLFLVFFDSSVNKKNSRLCVCFFSFPSLSGIRIEVTGDFPAIP